MKKLLWMMIIMLMLTGCAGNPEGIEEETQLSVMSIPSKVIETETESQTESETETQTESETESETEPERIPEDGELVRILDYIPDIVIDLRYATTNNFTQTIIYDDDEAYLCYGTVRKLMNVQDDLKEQGYRLIIWDAYRSVEAQQRLWEVYPDPTYVANPSKGITSHSRGNTIDIGLVYLDGSPVEMPSAFDEFSTLADRDYSEVPIEAARNAQLLEDTMKHHGFSGYWGEWWDYSDLETYELIIPED